MHNYRDIIDVPKIDWIPFDKRFATPDTARSAGLREKSQRGRPRVEPQPLQFLTHRDIGCVGKWKKIGKNKEGKPRVFCVKCHATRIVKYDA